MQRVGRACAVCRDGIHFEWSALGCAACGAAFHVACRAAEEAGAAYRSRSTGACSRCGGTLERPMRPPAPEPWVTRPALAERIVSAAFVVAAFLGMLVSTALVLAGGIALFMAVVARPADYVAFLAAALVSLSTGLAGLAVSALGIRTPWTAVARPPIETMSAAREPLLEHDLG